MFQKQCPNCQSSFSSKDRRQTTCSIECSKSWRKKNPPMPEVVSKLPQPLDTNTDLPPPDQLPAPYAKRVYEMWRSLVGESTGPQRIA